MSDAQGRGMIATGAAVAGTGAAVGAAFSHAAGRTGPAWDFYMVFGADATWLATGVPSPAWWEQQLGGLPAAQRLDPVRFAAKAAVLEGAVR